MKLSGHVTHPHMIASFLMQDIARILRQLVDQHMRRLGLTRAQWFLLNFVFLYEGLSQQELADLIDFGKSSVAKHIQSLEEKGFVRRSPHETDGRSFRVYLLPDMKTTIKKLNDLASLVLGDVLSKLNPGDVPHLINMLRGIDLQLEEELDKKEPAPEVSALVEKIRLELLKKGKSL